MKIPRLQGLAARVLPLMASLAGCSLAADDFAGKTCVFQTDCPASYSCVETGPSLRTCEVVQAPLGTATPEPLADPADWCNDVKPLLVKYCGECHGADTSKGVDGFRLHQYENAGPDGNEQGAKEKAARIKVRLFDAFGQSSAMPPPDYAVQPSKEEAETVSRWVRSQTPRVLEGRADCTDSI